MSVYLVEFLLARLDEKEEWARRLLADVAKKRQIVEGFEYLDASFDLRQYVCTSALRAMARPYADHPDYRAEWALPTGESHVEVERANR